MGAKIFIAGIGTSVGKTQVSAYLMKKWGADYWKPVECGPESDTETMHSLVQEYTIHPPVYRFKAPVSPHYAAKLEGMHIDFTRITPPETNNLLIIEMAGGILSPLTDSQTNLDLFSRWEGKWIVVSRHYLGSINHTLMTINTLKQAGAHIEGIIFYGKANAISEAAITALSQIRVLC